MNAIEEKVAAYTKALIENSRLAQAEVTVKQDRIRARMKLNTAKEALRDLELDLMAEIAAGTLIAKQPQEI